MEFKKIILENCVNDIIDYRGKTPKKLKGEWNENGAFRAVSAKNIKNMQLVNLDSLKKVDYELYKKWMKKEVSKNDILLTSEAPLGESLFWDSDEKIVLSQRVFGLKPNTDIVNPKYLFAYLQTPKFKHELTSRESGTTVTGIRRKELEKTIIEVPSQNIQKFIGDLFYITNKKIKNNQNIIANLEELSQTLFKRWFVDFEFPDENGNSYKSSGGEMVDSELGEIPRSWKVDELGNYIKIKSGKRPKNKVDNKDIENMVPIIGASKIMGYTNDYIYNEKIIIIGRVGTHGVIQRFSTKTWPSDNTFVITSDFESIIYQLLKSIDYISLNRGSTQPLLSQKDIKNTKVAMPSNETLLSKYQQENNHILKMMDQKNIENQKLTQLRDTLLPKLMSGEIEIPDDIEVNEDELSI